MTLTSLAYNYYERAAYTWQCENIDEILIMGDQQYLNALQSGQIPDAPTLSVDHLPIRIFWRRLNQQNTNLPVEATNSQNSNKKLLIGNEKSDCNNKKSYNLLIVEDEIKSPIVVNAHCGTRVTCCSKKLPFLAPTVNSELLVDKNELPIVASLQTSELLVGDNEPIFIYEAKNLCSRQFSTVSSNGRVKVPSERTHVTHATFVIFGNIYQGSVFDYPMENVGSPFVSLHAGLFLQKVTERYWY